MATAYRPRTSVAWDHFEIKDRDKGIATCNICHVAFSYRTSVSNLMKHLKNRHGYSVVKGDDDENEHTENGEKGSIQSKIKTELWEYFEVKDEENKQATCTICLDQFTFAESLAELFQHLKGKHGIDFGKDADKSDEDSGAPDDEEDFSTQTVSEHKTRPKSSLAWDYFEIKDEDKKVASCLTCGALCSFRSSVSNLMKHARRKHGVQIELQEDDSVIDSLDAVAEVVDSKIFSEQSMSSRAQRSIVWLYFKKIDADNKLSKCLLCHKTLSHSTTLTNLKKHLARKHPNVKIPMKEDGQKRILLSSGGELYEVETTSQFDEDADDALQNDTLEMDTVFLEDFDALQDDQPSTKTKGAPAKRKRSCSSSSEEEITFVNRYKRKQSDSFDHFAKYLASLLRSLPKEKSSKLQVDFLKQIMDVEKDDFGELK